jgi:hypothetical protein
MTIVDRESSSLLTVGLYESEHSARAAGELLASTKEEGFSRELDEMLSGAAPTVALIGQVVQEGA